MQGPVVRTFDVRTPGTGTAARALSGGNLQKFVLGREILQEPEIIVVNQPTWGVDAAAAAFIRQALLDRAAKGAAVVVISQDIDEIMEIADRFAALNEGRLSEPVPVAGLTLERIGLMPEILPRYRSTYYLHIFGGGYSAGYYSYIWAQVLDADAFQAFKETSLFDSEAAARFRKFILERSGTDEAMKLYKEFRGAEPKVDALLKRKGLD